MDREGTVQTLDACDWETDPPQAVDCWRQMAEHLSRSGVPREKMDVQFQALYTKLRESFEQARDGAAENARRCARTLEIGEAMMLLCYNASSTTMQSPLTEMTGKFSAISGVPLQDLPCVEAGQWCVKYLSTPDSCIRLALRCCDDQWMGTMHVRTTKHPTSLLTERSAAFRETLRWELERDALRGLF